jgi:ATP-dependent RNA helicase RhlE
VLDEADRMLDYLPAERQTLLFSATIPLEIVCLAASVLCDPVRVEVGPGIMPAARIIQTLCPVPEHLKMPLLVVLLNPRRIYDH